MLQPDRHPQGGLAHPRRRQPLARNRIVGGAGRMADQRLRPPRLTARRNNRSPSSSRKASASPPRRRNEKVEPAPRHWRCNRACSREPGSARPRRSRPRPSGWAARKRAMVSGALAGPRRAQVQGLQRAQQQPGGVRVHGVAEARCAAPSAARSGRRRPLTPPARRSLWPPQYLVSEVRHEVGAERQRALQQRAEEGVVHRRAAAGNPGCAAISPAISAARAMSATGRRWDWPGSRSRSAAAARRRAPSRPPRASPPRPARRRSGKLRTPNSARVLFSRVSTPP